MERKQSTSSNRSIHPKRVNLTGAIVLIALLLTACGAPVPAASQPSEPAQTGVQEERQPAPAPTNTAGTPLPDSPAPTDTPVIAPTETPVPTSIPLPTNTPAPTLAPLFYNLPATKLTAATGLYASPNRGEFIIPATIPVGESVFVMGRNATSSHLRAVWNTGVGWIPVSFTDYNGRRDRLNDLPVFEREPPACAEPITTQFGLNSKWVSDRHATIFVVVDLFRSQYGPFPQSSLVLRMNDVVIDRSRRQIVEQGQFSLKDIVFSLPQNVQPGDTVGYVLETSSKEPLTFMSTIFSVPQGCQWDIDS